jgi:hypothetical protein
LWWSYNGRPNDPTKHSTFCGYCEFVWHKIRTSATKKEFADWACAEESKRELEHYRGEVIKIKKELRSKPSKGKPNP